MFYVLLLKIISLCQNELKENIYLGQFLKKKAIKIKPQNSGNMK